MKGGRGIRIRGRSRVEGDMEVGIREYGSGMVGGTRNVLRSVEMRRQQNNV